MIKEIINSIYKMSMKSIDEVENLVEYEYREPGDIFIKKGKRNADKVTLILNPGGIKSIYRYECIGKTISTELSVNTNSHTFDVSSSDSAVMMYN